MTYTECPCGLSVATGVECTHLEPVPCVDCGTTCPAPWATLTFGPGNETCPDCAVINGHGHAEDDASIDVTADECPVCEYIAQHRVPTLVEELVRGLSRPSHLGVELPAPSLGDAR